MHLEARAVAVVVRAGTVCLRMRGAAKRGADMVTTAFRGEFERNQASASRGPRTAAPAGWLVKWVFDYRRQRIQELMR